MMMMRGIDGKMNKGTTTSRGSAGSHDGRDRAPHGTCIKQTMSLLPRDSEPLLGDAYDSSGRRIKVSLCLSCLQLQKENANAMLLT